MSLGRTEFLWSCFIISSLSFISQGADYYGFRRTSSFTGAHVNCSNLTADLQWTSSQQCKEQCSTDVKCRFILHQSESHCARLPNLPCELPKTIGRAENSVFEKCPGKMVSISLPANKSSTPSSKFTLISVQDWPELAEFRGPPYELPFSKKRPSGIHILVIPLIPHAESSTTHPLQYIPASSVQNMITVCRTLSPPYSAVLVLCVSGCRGTLLSAGRPEETREALRCLRRLAGNQLKEQISKDNDQLLLDRLSGGFAIIGYHGAASLHNDTLLPPWPLVLFPNENEIATRTLFVPLQHSSTRSSGSSQNSHEKQIYPPLHCTDDPVSTTPDSRGLITRSPINLRRPETVSHNSGFDGVNSTLQPDVVTKQQNSFRIPSHVIALIAVGSVIVICFVVVGLYCLTKPCRFNRLMIDRKQSKVLNAAYSTTDLPGQQLSQEQQGEVLVRLDKARGFRTEYLFLGQQSQGNRVSAPSDLCVVYTA